MNTRRVNIHYFVHIRRLRTTQRTPIGRRNAPVSDVCIIQIRDEAVRIYIMHD